MEERFLFLFIEDNEGRRKAIADLCEKFPPNELGIIRANRAEATTADTKYHRFDAIYSNGEFDPRGGGSLDFVEQLARQDISVPLVIHSSRPPAEVEANLQHHGLSVPDNHRFDAKQKGSLEEAVERMRKTAQLMRAIQEAATTQYDTSTRNSGGSGHLPNSKRMPELGF